MSNKQFNVITGPDGDPLLVANEDDFEIKENGLSLKNSGGVGVESAVFQHRVGSGTPGGPATGTLDWFICPVNSEFESQIWASLDLNIITLDAGQYDLAASRVFGGSNKNRLRLRKTVGAVTTTIKTSVNQSSTGSAPTPGNINHGFILSEQSEIFIEYYCQSSVGGTTLGFPFSTGDDEIYSDIIIKKVG